MLSRSRALCVDRFPVAAIPGSPRPDSAGDASSTLAPEDLQMTYVSPSELRVEGARARHADHDATQAALQLGARLDLRAKQRVRDSPPLVATQAVATASSYPHQRKKHADQHHRMRRVRGRLHEISGLALASNAAWN